MSDDAKTTDDEPEEGTAPGASDADGDADTSEEPSGARKGARHKMGDGIRQGLGVLTAFREALEETIHEARERGDLSADRAREVVKEALDRAQAAGEKARDRAQAAGERARDRLDFATHADMEGLLASLEALRARVARLEESVFGSAAERDANEVAGAGADTSEPEDRGSP